MPPSLSVTRISAGLRQTMDDAFNGYSWTLVLVLNPVPRIRKVEPGAIKPPPGMTSEMLTLPPTVMLPGLSSTGIGKPSRSCQKDDEFRLTGNVWPTNAVAGTAVVRVIKG